MRDVLKGEIDLQKSDAELLLQFAYDETGHGLRAMHKQMLEDIETDDYIAVIREALEEELDAISGARKCAEQGRHDFCGIVMGSQICRRCGVWVDSDEKERNAREELERKKDALAIITNYLLKQAVELQTQLKELG